MQQGQRAVLAMTVAGLIGLAAGCGGGDGGSGSTTRTFAGHTVTVPTTTAPRPSTNRSGTTTGTGTNPTSFTLPNGQTFTLGQLTPFRNCLRTHGVQPPPLGGSQSTFTTPTTPQQRQHLETEIRVWFTCAPQLPAPLRQRLERYRQQFEQRQRSSRG
jgi:hypothetical protein